MEKIADVNFYKFIAGLIGVLITVIGTLLLWLFSSILGNQERFDLRQREILTRLSAVELGDRWTGTQQSQYSERVQGKLYELDKEITKCCAKH